MALGLSDNIFRGYDIRGRVPEELNSAGAFILGQAYGTFLSRRRINQAVAVCDNRVHSETLKTAFINGLLQTGINVIDHGLGLVYFMYFSQYFNQSKGGVSVSASHNPAEYNGFKLAVGFSDTMITEEISELKSIVKAKKFTQSLKPGQLTHQPIFPAYKKDLFKRFPEPLNFKVVVDGGNCTPGKFLPEILSAAGCQVIAQNTDLDGNFPLGVPDPTESEYLNRVAKSVISHHADLGLCYDPDGDRLGIVDEDGTKIWNDVLVALFAQDVLDFLPASQIIYNVLCSKIVADTVALAGGRSIMWLTGHSFIKSKVKETRSPFGGELSGHFFFMDNFYGHDDGAYATLRLLSYLKRTKQSLKQAIKKLPRYFSSPEIKIGLADEIKFDFIRQILSPALKKLFPQSQAIEIDGIRLDTSSEMVIVRASQNGPYLTIKFEAKTKTQYDQLKIKLKTLLTSYKQIDWSYGVNVSLFR